MSFCVCVCVYVCCHAIYRHLKCMAPAPYIWNRPWKIQRVAVIQILSDVDQFLHGDQLPAKVLLFLNAHAIERKHKLFFYMLNITILMLLLSIVAILSEFICLWWNVKYAIVCYMLSFSHANFHSFARRSLVHCIYRFRL